MKLIIADDYASLSQQAADDLIELVKDYPTPVVCTASGDTPAGLYKMLVEKSIKENTSFDHWYFVGLDEWTGMNGTDQGSCRYHLNNQLLLPLKIQEERIIFPDGRANDLQGECNRIENFIRQHAGIDVSILGLGMNGHIGMNEPGTAANARTHISELDPLTQQVGQKYFAAATPLTTGITLGLGTLLESKHIILLVSGKHKASIIKEVLEGAVSNTIPGTLLRNHPGLSVYLDKDAAALLNS